MEVKSKFIGQAVVVLGILALSSSEEEASSLSETRILHRTKRWEEFPNATFTFDCTGRSIGFYADLEFDCQIFHLCDGQGRRVPYMCDKNTAFNQRFRVCDWAYRVKCEDAPNWYYLNDLTYREDPQ